MFDFENTPIKKDTNLIAQWGGECAGYTVSFDLDGGTSSVPIPNQIVKEGETATYPAASPNKDGCKFIGWYNSGDPDGGQPEPDAGGTVNVMFRVDGGSPQPAAQEVVKGTIAQYPGAVSKEGCEFLGWYKAGETPDLTVYTVTFDTDGGSTVVPAYVWAGEPVTQPAYSPTKEGVQFSEWTLNGTPYDFSQPVNSDITLVASYIIPVNSLTDLQSKLQLGGG